VKGLAHLIAAATEGVGGVEEAVVHRDVVLLWPGLFWREEAGTDRRSAGNRQRPSLSSVFFFLFSFFSPFSHPPLEHDMVVRTSPRVCQNSLGKYRDLTTC
jgi:hypothetical protein